ncbi:MAG: response regulator [Bacteroidota bacterium]
MVIEDNHGDYDLVEDYLLENVNEFILKRAETFRDAKGILEGEQIPFDVILLDLSLPDKTGTELINEIVAKGQTTPVIVLTGYENLQFGVKSLSLGIADYVLKDGLTSQMLYKSILYSCERKKQDVQLLKHLKAIEDKNSRLRDIAWIQSHIVRAPLSRMMGLIDLFANHADSEEEKRMLSNYILDSAHELDKIITDITNKVHEE